LEEHDGNIVFVEPLVQCASLPSDEWRLSGWITSPDIVLIGLREETNFKLSFVDTSCETGFLRANVSAG
jgi:hypothetical protein